MAEVMLSVAVVAECQHENDLTDRSIHRLLSWFWAAGALGIEGRIGMNGSGKLQVYVSQLL